MRFAWLVAMALPLFVVAHEGATGIVKERMDRFDQSKQQMKALRGALSGDDIAEAQLIASQLAQWASTMTEYFPEDSNPAPSEALDDIWLDWEGFAALAADFEQAATVMTESPSMTNFKTLGGTCKACHDAYRE